MTPQKVTLRVPSNGTLHQQFALVDFDVATQTRVPHRMIGSQLRLQLWPVEAPGVAEPVDPALDLSTLNGGLTMDDQNRGLVSIHVSAVTMDNLNGDYLGDMVEFAVGNETQPRVRIRLEVERGWTTPNLV